MARPSTVHLIAGQSAAGCVAVALADSPSDCVIPLADALSCGPVAPLESIAQWSDLRRRFWRTVEASPTPSFEPPLVPDLTNLRDTPRFQLWLGTGLSDQLSFVWVPQLLRLLGIDVGRLRIVQFPTDFSPRHQTPSLAMLNPDEVRRHPAPQTLSDDQLHTLDRAWQAISAPTPAPLAELLKENMRSLALLRDALSTAVGRYPDLSTGLPRWDHRLLTSVAAHGPEAVSVVAHALTADGWQPDPVGDGWLLWRLRRLADEDLAAPLVELKGIATELRTTSVRLTDAGERVLDGSLNAVTANGIDDWVFGAHLDSAAGLVWFASGQDLIPASAV